MFIFVRRPKVTKMKHLTKEQRYAISLMLKEKKTQKEIADAIGVNKSTVCREIQRNSSRKGYSYILAQESAEIRKERLREPRKLNMEVRQRIEKLMREEDWSPCQIEGWCRRNGYRMVSKSSIYEYIRKDRDSGGDLYKHCRFKLKHRKRPVGKYMPIKNRVGIEERPKEADGTRFGDWEMDLIVGAGNKGAMVTLVERSTSYSMIRRLPHGKSAEGVADAVVDMLWAYKAAGAVKTITTDNGPEFSEHEKIAKKLGTKVYFADPYCSWQKGHIENTNMLYREYIPCDSHFLEHSDEEIREIQYKLNRRPRKKIGFKLPYQEFFLHLQR